MNNNIPKVVFIVVVGVITVKYLDIVKQLTK